MDATDAANDAAMNVNRPAAGNVGLSAGPPGLTADAAPADLTDGREDAGPLHLQAGELANATVQPPPAPAGRIIIWWRGLTTEQIVTGTLSVIGVVAATVFIWLQVQPSLLLRNTLTAGGDMGAHVWGPDYLRRELLPNWTLSGWTPDWYAGFPAYKFYMVVPALAVVVLDLVPGVPYAVAFKLVTVSGLVTMPLAAWFMGRMFRLRFPGPPLLAFATLPFLFDFDERFRIIGGNMASTMAGEFSFSISLTLCLVYLGVVARGLETGKHRAWGAALFSLVLLNHLIPAMFAVVATLLLGLWRLAADTRHGANLAAIGAFVASVPLAGWAGYEGHVPVVLAVALPVLALGVLLFLSISAEPGWRSTLWWVAPAGLCGAMLSAFWSVPFLANRDLFNDMGWERIQTYRDYLGPAKSLTLVWYAVFALGIVAVVLSIVERQLIGVFLASSAVAMGVLFATWPHAQMWNARFLPFYYLSLYLLAAVGLTLFINSLPGLGFRSVGGAVAAVGLLFCAALPLGAVPGSKMVGGQESFYGLVDAPPTFVDDWARWNYRGYQGKDKWPEYKAVVDTMAGIGRDRGCGRAMWEYQTEKLNSYGTPMALMLLPYWTKGCIGSMEGLYFESSATTPYHFMNQSELSEKPSRAQRDLPYNGLDVDLGTQHLQLMGVRYYMALSDAAKGQAAANDQLTEVATSGPWTIFEVADSELVTPLEHQPAVLTDVGTHQEDWLGPSAEFYNDPDRWNVMLAADGPASWERVSVHTTPQASAAQPLTVTNINQHTNSISFDVDQVGVPVLVKSSYFPNWQVDGGEGPYRVMPNLMVVIPTSTHVNMHFARNSTDWGGLGLTGAGMMGLLGLAVAKPLTIRRPGRVQRVPINSPDQLDISRYLLSFQDPLPELLPEPLAHPFAVPIPRPLTDPIAVPIGESPPPDPPARLQPPSPPLTQPFTPAWRPSEGAPAPSWVPSDRSAPSPQPPLAPGIGEPSAPDQRPGSADSQALWGPPPNG